MNEIQKRIITTGDFTLRQKIKNILLYNSRKKGAQESWKQRHYKVFKFNELYSESCNSKIESEYQRKWSAFRNKVNLSTLRISNNISGYADVRMVPEDVFVSDIEPTLSIDSSVDYLSNKSFYNRWFQLGLFPKDFLHNIEGRYFNEDLKEISFQEFRTKAKKLSYPLVLKPNRNTYGGKGVCFVQSSKDIINLATKRKNFVIQEKIQPHLYFKKFNPFGLNTIRVYLFRSVTDYRLSILNMALRMGRNGSLDNETAGGIHCLIRPDGRLNGYAVDKYGRKFNKHPDSGLKFNSHIPKLEGLKALAIEIGKNIFLTRIIGLDACLDENGRWRAIEINTKGHTTRFAQYGGQPFFGDFTDEVIEYCKNNHWALR